MGKLGPYKYICHTHTNKILSIKCFMKKKNSSSLYKVRDGDVAEAIFFTKMASVLLEGREVVGGQLMLLQFDH